MKIVLAGSLGHIGKPLTKELVQKGHQVTVISSNIARKQEIGNIGATAAVGSLEDAAFLTAAFTGADAVYTMVPPNNYYDPELNLIDYYVRLGTNYERAVRESGVKRVVNLSSIGAHLDKGSGILVGAHKVEGILNTLPAKVTITHIRPTSFFYNLYGYIAMIRSQGVIAANYGADNTIPWVSPKDIAAAVAQELTRLPEKREVRYVGSEDLTGNEVAAILGKEIGKPDLKWILISDEEVLEGLGSAGMNPAIAAGLVEMYCALHSGLLSEDYLKNKPVMGRERISDFAKEFAAAYSKI